jgi:hypothetical protein
MKEKRKLKSEDLKGIQFRIIWTFVCFFVGGIFGLIGTGIAIGAFMLIQQIVIMVSDFVPKNPEISAGVMSAFAFGGACFTISIIRSHED